MAFPFLRAACLGERQGMDWTLPLSIDDREDAARYWRRAATTCQTKGGALGEKRASETNELSLSLFLISLSLARSRVRESL